MLHRFARFLGKRATQCLPVDGDQFAAGRFVKGLRPLKQTRCEVFPVRQAEDPTKRIVGGNAIGQFQKRFQPRVPRPAKLLNIRPILRPAHHSSKRDRDNV